MHVCRCMQTSKQLYIKIKKAILLCNSLMEKYAPRGSKENPFVRKPRTVSLRNHSLHIGIPQLISFMSEIDENTKFYVYIDFPDRNRIVLERIVPKDVDT